MLECEDNIEELNDDLKDLAEQKFENVTTEFENQISLIEHEIDLIDELINQTEKQGYLVGKSFYEALMAQEESRLADLQEEYANLTYTLQELLDTGLIEKYSDQWYEMTNQINDVA